MVLPSEKTVWSSIIDKCIRTFVYSVRRARLTVFFNALIFIQFIRSNRNVYVFVIISSPVSRAAQFHVLGVTSVRVCINYACVLVTERYLCSRRIRRTWGQKNRNYQRGQHK